MCVYALHYLLYWQVGSLPLVSPGEPTYTKFWANFSHFLWAQNISPQTLHLGPWELYLRLQETADGLKNLTGSVILIGSEFPGSTIFQASKNLWSAL